MQSLRLDSLIGKPVTVYKDGKRRVVGTITAATFVNDHIQFSAGITDEDVLGSLNHARLSLNHARLKAVKVGG